jgi:hypothetical protein
MEFYQQNAFEHTKAPNWYDTNKSFAIKKKQQQQQQQQQQNLTRISHNKDFVDRTTSQ